MNGSITKMAHKPSTTDGTAANNSTIKPMKFLIFFGIMFSVMKIAVPTPKGMAMKSDKIEVISVP